MTQTACIIYIYIYIHTHIHISYIYIYVYVFTYSNDDNDTNTNTNNNNSSCNNNYNDHGFICLSRDTVIYMSMYRVQLVTVMLVAYCMLFGRGPHFRAGGALRGRRLSDTKGDLVKGLAYGLFFCLDLSTIFGPASGQDLTPKGWYFLR